MLMTNPLFLSSKPLLIWWILTPHTSPHTGGNCSKATLYSVIAARAGKIGQKQREPGWEGPVASAAATTRPATPSRGVSETPCLLD